MDVRLNKQGDINGKVLERVTQPFKESKVDSCTRAFLAHLQSLNCRAQQEAIECWLSKRARQNPPTGSKNTRTDISVHETVIVSGSLTDDNKKVVFHPSGKQRSFCMVRSIPGDSS